MEAKAFPAKERDQKKGISDDVVIGKDILELVTGAMYVDPLCIYREYIQNSCDAIDEARSIGLYGSDNAAKIEILLNQSERSIRIRDNGIGVPASDFKRRLTAIGGSRKRGMDCRGFRGVGRLSGLGYCQEVVFRTRSKNEDGISQIIWDGRKLKDVLRKADYPGNLADAVREIAAFSVLQDIDYPTHFFEVELRKISRLKNDVLLNESEVRTYLSQVAPVPFHPDFAFATDLSSFLERYSIDGGYYVSLNDGNGQIYRPFRNTFPVNDKIEDRFESFRPLTFVDTDGNTSAVGWTIDHSYFGAIPKRAPVAGLRLRAGNIQVGSPDLLAPLFAEQRFNGWCVGEFHILSKRVLPNGRRDDFEPSVHYQHFQAQISPLVRELTKTCRDRSALRNRLKQANIAIQSAREALMLLDGKALPAFLISFVETRVTTALENLNKIIAAQNLRPTDQELIQSQIHVLTMNLESALKRVRRRVRPRGSQRGIQAAYGDVLRLIYEFSPSGVEAHKLATKIIQALHKKA
jgi:molecular chaperone HtpG